MVDPWDELRNSQKQQKRCAEDVEAIKAACAKDHSKSHVVECPECWGRLLNRMRDRYLNSAEKEWFSGRRQFLQELDDLFSKAHKHEVDMKAIEERIHSEKDEWFRDKVRNMGLQSAIKTPSETRALVQTLNDRSIPVEKLLADVRSMLKPDGDSIDEAAFSGFLEQLRAAQSSQERAEAYINIFFRPKEDPSSEARYRPYIDNVRNGAPIHEVVAAMARDRQAVQGTQKEKTELQNKLEELKRARAAYDAAKAKKTKTRQESHSKTGAYDLPTCAMDGKPIEPDSFYACEICLVFSENYKLQDRPTLFCSTKCQTKGQETHGKTHECSAGQRCVMLEDEDVDMDQQEPVTVLCQECVESLKIPTIFCSARCFDANFQRHRDELHLPEREHLKSDINDESQLEFADESKLQYRARKIEDHLITLDAAMKDYYQTTGASC